MLQLRPVSEDTIMLYLGDRVDPQVNDAVQAAVGAIERCLGDDLVDLIPSYASILVIYDALRRDYREVAAQLRQALAAVARPDPGPAARGTGRTVVLPVYYGPEAGADFARLARDAGLEASELIALHSGVEYRVYAIGFAPGFAYLGEVDERLAAPRLATPRQRVPAGSVAIADRQTAVYPAPSPGGWNLIGRCPVPMFDPAADRPMPVAVGDRVCFEPVSRERFLELGGELA